LYLNNLKFILLDGFNRFLNVSPPAFLGCGRRNPTLLFCWWAFTTNMQPKKLPKQICFTIIDKLGIEWMLANYIIRKDGTPVFPKKSKFLKFPPLQGGLTPAATGTAQ